MATEVSESMENMTLSFYTEECKRQLEVIKQHGHEVKSLTVLLDQKDKINRENACEVLNIFSSLENPKLSSLTMKFVGENPLFFSGQEFIKSLKSFFQSKNQNGDTGNLLEVNVGELFVDFDKEFLEILSTNHRNLESLNIQNQTIISKVHPSYIVYLLDKCRKLKRLSLFYINISDEVLDKMAEGNRAPLERLSIKLRHQDNYSNIIFIESWKKLSHENPNLKVEVIIASSFSPEKIPQILCPEIQVTDLKLETNFNTLDLKMVADYYSDSLENLVFPCQASEDLEEDLISLVTRCQKLASLYVYCKISDEARNQILKLCPKLAETKDFDF